jgi:hypothetical protein
MEERRKWYNEEVGGATDEEEAELTGMSFAIYMYMCKTLKSSVLMMKECFILDGDTSDEEYIQDEEAAKADSDACSDFDDDEAEKEADQSTNQEPDDHSDNDGDIDTDDDDDAKNMASQSRKHATASRRVLDSDSEDENEMKFPKNDQSEIETLRQAESTSEHPYASSTVSDNTVYSAVLFEDTRDCNEPIANLAPQREEVKARPLKKGGPRRSSTTLGGALLEEASMPPLMLNDVDSVQSDESSESSFADKSEADGEIKPHSSTIGEDLGFHSEEARQPFSTQPVQDEEGEGRDVGGGEPDNSSLELSLLWQPSMPPPAQVRKDSSEELLPPTKVSFAS